MFSGSFPRSRVDRWRLLDEVIARWFLAEDERARIPPEDLDEAESRLGLRLPAALREWHERYGALTASVWSLQDDFLSPSELVVEHGALVFCRENQGVVQWGIGLDELSSDDPAVLLSWSPGRDWTVEAESTSGFALQLVALNAKFSSMPFHLANGEATEEACRAVENALPRLPLPDLHWPAAPTRFYGDGDLLVENEADTWLWVTARSRHAFERIQSIADTTGLTWEALNEP
jgi:hypothetical protein